MTFGFSLSYNQIPVLANMAVTREVFKVGKVDQPDSDVVRIIHISDTHMRHDQYTPCLPDGDILIHSGDFSQWSFGTNSSRHRELVVHEVNRFFSNLPHKHKIFVAGNHESGFNSKDKEYLERNLTSVTYLQDKLIDIEGIKIYGTPWTSKRWYSLADEFTKDGKKLDRVWDFVPDNVDILVTHMPPLGIGDLAAKKFAGIRNFFSSSERTCSVCQQSHPLNSHWGCEHLRDTVLKRVKPVLHLYGHVHEQNGIRQVEGITFSNAAMKLDPSISIFEFYK